MLGEEKNRKFVDIALTFLQYPLLRASVGQLFQSIFSRSYSENQYSFSRSVFIYLVSCSISHWESYSRSIIQSLCQSVGQLFTFSVIHSFRQPVRQLVSQLFTLSVNRSVIHFLSHSFISSASPSVTQSVIYSVSQSVSYSLSQSFIHFVSQSVS